MASPEKPWDRAIKLFDQLADLGPDEQEKRLAELDLDSETEEELRSLLAADRHDGGLLDTPARMLDNVKHDSRSAEQGMEDDTQISAEEPWGHPPGRGESDGESEEGRGSPFIGRQIGSWVLVEEIARGGSAIVFQARRVEEGFDQLAALKLLTLGALGTDHSRYFLRERDLLSRLKHPHIATLLDGGVAEDGTPYLVTELVDGEPLDRFCESRNLGLEERLDLFLQVCDAVAYAHRQLIVHRDLKPSNILADEEGGVRLLDFGIAKWLEQGDSTRSVPSFTPAYASPEQWAGELATTATDVYGLGLVLHLLLTGHQPPSLLRLREPTGERLPAPSKISTDRRIDRDLDAIIAHATQTDPVDRYPDARALADDLKRWRAGHPTVARPAGHLERSLKFVRRHLLVVAACALAVVSLMTLAGVSLWQQQQTAQERDRAQKESETARATVALLRDFLSSADPTEGDRDLTVLELLDAFKPRLETIEDQEIRANLLFTYATTYRSLGLPDQSFEFLQKALALQRKILGPQHADTILSTTDMALVEFERGHLDRAEEAGREALGPALEHLGPDHPVTLDSLDNLALVLVQQGRFAEGEALWRQALEARARVHGVDDSRTVTSKNGLAMALMSLGRLDEAEVLFSEALDQIRKSRGEDHFHTLTAINNLAFAQVMKSDYGTAVPMFRDLAERLDRVLGPDHPRAMASRSNLAAVLGRSGRHEEAEPLLRELVEQRSRILGPEHPDTLAGQALRCKELRHLGRLEEADALGRLVLEQRRKVLGPEHPNTISSMIQLAHVLELRRELEESEDLLRRGSALRAKVLGEDHRDTLTARGYLAAVLRGLGRTDSALAENRAAFERAEQVLGASDLTTLELQLGLGLALLAAEQLEAALEQLRRGQELTAETLPETHPLAKGFAEALSDLEAADG